MITFRDSITDQESLWDQGPSGALGSLATDFCRGILASRVGTLGCAAF